jgi:undecaprenyl phosphate N,N'-diacetylbacillosamine 1-phosphate transferase
MNWLRRGMKRILDVGIAVIGLVLLGVPFLVVALLIKMDSRGPVFFRQERIGKGGRSFCVWKFRTMIVGAINKGLGVTVARYDDRITRIGRILRNLGLDELPQLINVLTGEMSLVGPRPTLAYQVDQYNDFQRRRLEARPGITSVAVVSGRNSLSWNQRIELDVWYVDHQSFVLDLKILFRTVWCVLVTREGLYGEDGINDRFVPTSDMKDEGEL